MRIVWIKYLKKKTILNKSRVRNLSDIVFNLY